MTRASLRVLSLLLPLLLAGFSFVSAQEQTPSNADFISQLGLRNLENALVIHADPAYPTPGSTVNLTVESPIFDLQRDEVTWTINGQVVAQGVGKITTNASINAQGSALNITVTAVDPLWGSAARNIMIVPVQLEILYEGSSYVPPFYRGRPLPSAGGMMQLQAVSLFVQDGKTLDDKDIIFTWLRNGKLIKNLSGQGKSKITIPAPSPFDTDIVSVRAVSPDETLSAAAQVSIKNSDVALAMYENHPLFGIMFHQMLPSEINRPADLTLSAIPYFAPVTRLDDPNLAYSWTLNNQPLQASSTKRNEISLRSETQSSALRLKVTHAINFFLEVTGKWTFLITSGGQSSSVGTDDVFHNSSI